MVLKISEQGSVPPFLVMDVLRAASEQEAAGALWPDGAGVLHMEIGQPSQSIPAGVASKVAEVAIGDDPLGYTMAPGIARLRQRIAEHSSDVYGVDVDPDRIFCTMGSSAGFLMTFLTAFEPGDRVGLAAPGYPAYRHILKSVGLEAVLIETDPQTRFQPTPRHLAEITPQLDGLIVASPSNPTGSMLQPDELKDLAEYCHLNGIRLVSDEIYHGISYGMQAATAAAYSSSAVVVNSFSKYYCMTGWRLGWLVLPDDMVRSVECLAQNLFISAPTISQVAASHAFDCLEVYDGFVADYARNRDVVIKGLAEAGISKVAPPDGAFYIYADISHLGLDSRVLSQRMLSEIGIAAAPGWDFDPVRGGDYIRFSYAGSFETCSLAMQRLRTWLPTLSA